MDDPSPPATSVVPQQLLQPQRQQQQPHQLLLLHQCQPQLMIQQQQRMHQEQSQCPQAKPDLPHLLQELKKHHDHDKVKQPDQHQHQHFQYLQQQLLALSRSPSSIDPKLFPGVQSIQFQQQRAQQQTVQPPASTLPSQQPLQGAGAVITPVATAPKQSSSAEMDEVLKDASMVCKPNVEKPFSSVEDAVRRLLPYHILADYEAEEDDRMLDSDPTGKVPSRLQQWDQNVAARIEEYTSVFEKQVQDFNMMTQKSTAGEFRSEERLMIERALLQEEKQIMLQLRAGLEVRDRLERAVAESSLRVAFNQIAQAKPEVSGSVTNWVSGEGSRFMQGLGSFGHEGEAIADWDGNVHVQHRDPSINYSWEREVARANSLMAVPQIDQTRAMVPFPSVSTMVGENPGLVPKSEFFRQVPESMIDWNDIGRGEHRDPSVNEKRQSVVGGLLGQWRDAGNTK